jgi:hypothetical protein
VAAAVGGGLVAGLRWDAKTRGCITLRKSMSDKHNISDNGQCSVTLAALAPQLNGCGQCFVLTMQPRKAPVAQSPEDRRQLKWLALDISGNAEPSSPFLTVSVSPICKAWRREIMVRA